MSAVQEMFRRDRVFDFMVPKVVEDLDLSHGTVLYMEDVSVAFDGFKAINELNFYVNAGELRCLIGPNGAGKTTMMDIITGKTRPDKGTCWFGARMNLLQMSEPEIAQVGIGHKLVGHHPLAQQPAREQTIFGLDPHEPRKGGKRIAKCSR